MSIYTPSPGTIGGDTSGAFSVPAGVQQIAANGYKFVVRYVACPGGMFVDVLTPPEASALLAAGVAIGLIQAIQKAANISPENGTRDGASAAAQAKALGYPAGAVLWCDLEGIFHDAPALISYLNNWGKAVQAAGYPAGLYNGPQNLLTAAQIQALIFPHYWQPAANAPAPSRGYQLVQMAPPNVAAGGTAIDVDVVTRDHRGDLPTFWGP